MDQCAILTTSAKSVLASGEVYETIQQVRVVLQSKEDVTEVLHKINEILESKGKVCYTDLFTILNLARPYYRESFGWPVFEIGINPGFYSWDRRISPHEKARHTKKNRCIYLDFPEPVKIDE